MSDHDLIEENERLRSIISRNKASYLKLQATARALKEERDKALASHQYWYDKAGELSQKIKRSGGGFDDIFGGLFGGRR